MSPLSNPIHFGVFQPQGQAVSHHEERRSRVQIRTRPDDQAPPHLYHNGTYGGGRVDD